MNILATVKIAFRALRVNTLRSALTMLGIIIGVAAVITMVAVGSGAKAQIAQQIRSIGSNVIIVLSGSLTSGGIRLGHGSILTLSEDDAKAIAAECPAVALTASSVRGTGQVVFGNNNWSTVIQGTAPEFLEIRDFRVLYGRPFTRQDVDGATKVALVGQTVVENLFGGTDPIGQIIRIKRVPFTVIGVLSLRDNRHGDRIRMISSSFHLHGQEEGARDQPGQCARGGGHPDPGARPADDEGGGRSNHNAPSTAASPAAGRGG